MPKLELLGREMLTLARLSYPLMFAQLAVMGMAFTDAVVAGRVGTGDLAGITLAGGVWSPLIVLMITLVVAVNPFLAQHHGAGRHAEMGMLARQGMWIGLAAGLLIALGALLIEPLLADLATDREAVVVAQGYLNAIVFGAPALGLSVALRSVCETTGNTRITMWVYASALLLNAVLDVVLAFGWFGFPALGAVGCGWASALVYWWMLGVIALHLRLASRYRHLGLLHGRLGPQWREIRRILALGLPMGLGISAEIGFFSWIVMLTALDGAVPVAAHQIASNFSGLVFMLPLGLSMGITIRVAQQLGAGNPPGALLAARAGISLAVLIGACTALLTWWQAGRIAAAYSSDAQVLQLALALLPVAASFQIADAMQVSANGVLRACKDTFKPMLLMLASYWVAGFIAVLGFGRAYWLEGVGGVIGYWYGVVCAISLAALLLLWRARRVLARRAAMAAVSA
jgi:multidrug resistance protein, MATE family